MSDVVWATKWTGTKWTNRKHLGVDMVVGGKESGTIYQVGKKEDMKYKTCHLQPES